MGARCVRLRFAAALGRPSTIVVEPWAHEFSGPGNSTFELVTETTVTDQLYEIEVTPTRITVWANGAEVVSARLEGREVWP